MYLNDEAERTHPSLTLALKDILSLLVCLLVSDALYISPKPEYKTVIQTPEQMGQETLLE